jgi:hypothetical protein
MDKAARILGVQLNSTPRDGDRKAQPPEELSRSQKKRLRRKFDRRMSRIEYHDSVLYLLADLVPGINTEDYDGEVAEALSVILECVQKVCATSGGLNREKLAKYLLDRLTDESPSGPALTGRRIAK